MAPNVSSNHTRPRKTTSHITPRTPRQPGWCGTKWSSREQYIKAWSHANRKKADGTPRTDALEMAVARANLLERTSKPQLAQMGVADILDMVKNHQRAHGESAKERAANIEARRDAAEASATGTTEVAMEE
ncbi:hypothetical protein RQP46_001387 [Phenoliferia psychrophenolica]